MQQITVKVPDDTAESLSNVADDEFDGNRSEAVRELLRRGTEYEDLKGEYEQAEARVADLRRQLQQANAGERDVDEIVTYVEDERRVQQRREERRQANIFRRAWWYLAGTPENETME
jgi:Arc/MetJ-type ribon-helix-helix transcriptional regulator